MQKEGYAAGGSAYNEPVEGITLRIQRLRRATGTVVEVDGGPVAGAKVWAPGTATLTDNQGHFVLDQVGGWLSIQADGYVSNGVSVPPGHDLAVGIVRIQRAILSSPPGPVSPVESPRTTSITTSGMRATGARASGLRSTPAERS